MQNPPFWKPFFASFFVTLALLILANHAFRADGLNVDDPGLGKSAQQ